MNNNIKEFINKQFIISKLKKEAKILQRQNPLLSLMECQNKVAQQHGYLHWHELHTFVKKQYEQSVNSKCLNFVKNNNFLLGKDDILQQKIYLEPLFNRINIKNNNFAPNFIRNFTTSILEKNNSQLIYCHTGTNEALNLKGTIEQQALKNNIPLYYLSFTSQNTQETISLNFSQLSAPSLTELLLQGVTRYEDNESEKWVTKAISLLSSLSMALVYLRDKGEITLKPEVIQDNLSLSAILTLYKRTDLPNHIHTALKYYLSSVVGLDLTTQHISDFVREQHGFLQMQYIKILGNLNVYPQVFGGNNIHLEEVLNSQKKFVLIVNFPNFEETYQNKQDHFHIFMYLLKSSFKQYSIDKNAHDWNKYVLLAKMPKTNLNLPIKFNIVPVNYIFLDEQNYSEGITIIPEKEHIKLIHPISK